VASEKFPAAREPLYVPAVRSTVTVAPFRFVSLNDAGLVDAITAAASSTAVTATVPVVAGPVPVSNAAWSTVTDSVVFASKSVPSKASVSVALVAEFRTTLAIVVPVGAVASEKFPAASEPLYVPAVRSTVTVAPFRFVSLSDTGLVDAITAAASNTAVTAIVPVVAGPVPVSNAACSTVTDSVVL